MSHQSDDDVRRVSWPQHPHQHLSFVQVAGDLHPSLPHQLNQPLPAPPTTTVFGMPPSPPQQSSPPNICYSSGHPETYSVLPVGHGNFLKVYHSADSEQPQIIYNSYELFASNTITQPTPQQHTANPRGATLNEDTLVMDGMHSIPIHPPGFGGIETTATTTNMIINKLVNNWSPNLTGTYTQFGEQSTTASPIKTFVAANSALIQEGHYTATIDDNIQGVSPNVSPSPANQPKLQQNSIVNLTKTNGSFESNNPINVNPVPEVKKRIIAEVKPMRMSYSDVLSKINSQAVVGTPNGIINIPNNHGTETVAQATKSPKPSGAGSSDKARANAFPTERKVSPTSDERERIDSRGGGSRKQMEQQNTQQLNSTQMSSAGQQRGEKKRSPTHENKENIQIFSASLNKGAKKNPSKPQKLNIKQAPANLSGGDYTKKRLSKRDDEQNYNNGSKSNSSTGKSSNNGVNDKEGYYNVAKTDNNYERPQKYASQHNSTSTRKSRQSNGISFGSKTSNSRFERQQQLYSTNRRGQNRGAQKSSINKYELMKKFFDKWLLEYTIKILTWLFYLIYDIIVLGCSMAYERLANYYASGYAYFLIVRKDLKNNSNKPSLWLRNYLKRIDSKFKKNSKWAFWRRFYKKKPVENSPEFYKNGRLPQTGEEAMYSLLNCKGKDAYSILGVPANSSQEQIRKHYKKIAVLVHPDKNKQPGAEEAFKVLQRAFELIGEPENRAAYDQSLVEALHAEKAWTELHDLLSQLQTKIAEAANTIRCSSCGLRHPRKMTDRPHYAARECGSCKIRHSAREGDIWAETSWLRLRWKYLALMEGKVYDITEWANCQKGALSHLEPNSHMVQYRIVRGGQQQQQQQNQQQQQQQQQQKQQNSQQEKGKFKREPPSEATLDDFLDNLYSGQNPHGQPQSSTRRRARRN